LDRWPLGERGFKNKIVESTDTYLEITGSVDPKNKNELRRIGTSDIDFTRGESTTSGESFEFRVSGFKFYCFENVVEIKTSFTVAKPETRSAKDVLKNPPNGSLEIVQVRPT
jgi:hypothetical protein